jgi:hypothetical protein
MDFGRQTIASVAQLLAALRSGAAEVLLYKHLGTHRNDLIPPGAGGILDALRYAQSDEVKSLVGELVRENDAIRADASEEYIFNGRWRELERWLLHDGWGIENKQLVRLVPDVEESTGIRDKLLEELEATGLDGDRAIRNCIEDASKSFIVEPPNYNDSITKVRIALETFARRAARNLAQTRSIPYPQDSWGRALQFLKTANVLEAEEEEILTRVYTFISPGAHVPAGVTDEEWARLARTFALSSCYFLLKKYKAA